jgi:hypothetical protein
MAIVICKHDRDHAGIGATWISTAASCVAGQHKMLRCCVLRMAHALSNFAEIENDLPVDHAISEA